MTDVVKSFCGGVTLFLALSGGLTAHTLNVYSARHYESDNQLFEAFTAATGIAVQRVEGQDDALLQRLRSEGRHSPADVFITVDAGRLWAAEESDLFQAVDSELLRERIPAHLRHPEGLWYGFSKRARVIAYSRDRVDPETLTTYESLAYPQWRGRVLVRSSSNIYNQSLLGSLIEAHGAEAAEAWARGVVANLARRPQSNDTGQLRAIAAGLGDVALVNHYYYHRLEDSSDPADQAILQTVDLFYPNQEDRGTHINISGAGVLRHAPHPEAALTFLEWLSGDEGQKLFAEANYEFPANPRTPRNGRWSEIDFREDQLNAARIGQRNPEAIRIFDRAGWR